MKKINNNDIRPGDFFVANSCLQIVSERIGDYLYTISCKTSIVGYKKDKNGFWHRFPYGYAHKIQEIFRINDLQDLKDNIKYMCRDCYPADYDDMSKLYIKIKSGNFEKMQIHKVGDTFISGEYVVLIKEVLIQNYEIECINIKCFTIKNKNIYHYDFRDFKKIPKSKYNYIKKLCLSIREKMKSTRIEINKTLKQ